MDVAYCYAHTEVLRNKLNIHDAAKIGIAERKLTMLRIADLLRRPIIGKFDTKHLCKIHEYIFQDLYTWAGQIRTVEIAKGTYFCKTEYISNMLNQLFAELREEKYLKGLRGSILVSRLAYYMSEINAIHPFREGNGRAQREFIRELALQNDVIIHYESVSAERMISASIESFNGNYGPMEELLSHCIAY